MTGSENQDLGRRGEDLAARFLEEKGYRVLERRYRFDRSEVDLVCFQPSGGSSPGGEIVFVEVKARRGTGFGRPEDSVTVAKQKSVAHAASAYLYESRMERARCRFDVVAVSMDGDAVAIDHFENAFWLPA